MKSLRNLRLIGVALLGLTLAGTAGFHFIEGWSWFDGFYMVITTFTTIGYQETHPLSHAGRVFNVGLIIVGVSLVFLAIGSLTQALLEFELGSFFGRRKMEREISRLSDHYIICGAGRVGRSAARELASKHVPFIVVDQSAERAAGAWGRLADAGRRRHPGTDPARRSHRTRPGPGGRDHDRRHQPLHCAHRA